jgi:cysteine-rich repeat protein
MSSYTVSVLVPDDSPEGYETINGTASTAGVVRIDGVPDGGYWLRLHDATDVVYPYPHYFWSDERDLDLGIVVRGRDDTPATLATQVTFDVMNMAAWKEADQVDFSSVNNATDHATASPVVVVGATEVHVTLDWQQAIADSPFSDLHDQTRLPQLVDTAPPHGDDFRALHRRAMSVDTNGMRAVQVQTILEVADLTDVTMSNGTSATVTGTFAASPAVATPQTFGFNLNTARAAMRDGGRYSDESIRCFRYTNPAADDGLGGGMLWFVGGDIWPSQQNFNVSFPYTNPYPTQWPHTSVCTLEHIKVHKFPPNITRGGFSYLTGITPVTDNFNWTIATHGPENITVGGQDALAGGTVAFDGTAPVTIAWDEVTGVNHYAVRVLGLTTFSIAKFDTTETSIAMPADLFTMNELYVFRVYAIQTSGDYAGGRLYEVVRPLWSARVSTGYFRFSNTCGDGDVDAMESCDPGAAGNTVDCDADCTPAVCGDGFVNAAANEQCDDPPQFSSGEDTATCDNDCQIPACTDGHWNPAAEECDDGNQVDTDACTNACVLTTCGDSTMEPPFEACDDGNRSNGDGCNAFCQPDLDLR